MLVEDTVVKLVEMVEGGASGVDGCEDSSGVRGCGDGKADGGGDVGGGVSGGDVGSGVSGGDVGEDDGGGGFGFGGGFGGGASGVDDSGGGGDTLNTPSLTSSCVFTHVCFITLTLHSFSHSHCCHGDGTQ